MADSPPTGSPSSSTSQSGVVTLSTGTEIEFPLEYRKWSMSSAVFSASLSRLREILPTALAPIQIRPGRGAVALFAATYADAGPLEPYDEFAVLPLAKPRSTASRSDATLPTLPFTELEALRSFLGSPRSIHAYVYMMPVTTAEARALGTDIWGYPKELADISVQQADHQHRTTVTVDGDRVITFSVDRAHTRSQAVDLYAYAENGDRVVCGRIQTYGQYAFRPLVNGASYVLGTHPRAEAIRKLDLGSRPLLSVFAPSLRSRYHRAVSASSSQ